MLTPLPDLSDPGLGEAVARPDPQLDFVLTVCLRESGTRLPGLGWRGAADRDVSARLRVLLSSFLSHFRLEELGTFLLVCPDQDVRELTALLRRLTRDPRFQVVPETELCPAATTARDPETGQLRGWYVQQILKIAAAAHLQNERYVTLDSDVVCVRPFGYASLEEQGLPALGVETPEIYRRLYTDAFCATELRYKEERLAKSAELLGYERLPRHRARYYSETPVVFLREAMSRLCAHLEARHGMPWALLLARETGWTEHGLYYQFLEMTGELERRYALRGPNRVLHLERSVWQASADYRALRRYDRAHFTDPILTPPEGPFVVIQSWLGARRWLPQTGHRTVRGFYRSLRRWLELPPAHFRGPWWRWP